MEENATLRGRCYLSRTKSHWRPALFLVTSFLGCGGLVSSSPPQPPPSNISVAVAPSAASVLLGEARSFTATVSNSADTAVNWSVNQIPGGNATVGTVDLDGVYTAPQILPPPPSASLTATSAADPSKSGTATITITSSFSLVVTGLSSVAAGNAATYTATLTPAVGSNPSRVIFWSVAGAGCTGTECGKISSNGVYTAPSLPPSSATVQIIATPQADPSKVASVFVAILPAVAVTISPTSATVALGAAQAFHATVSGTQDATVTWDVDGVVGGNAAVGLILNSQTDPNDTNYTAPQALPVGGSVTVHARSNADPGVTAGATIDFTTAVNVTLSPSGAALAVGQRQTFVATVNNSPNQNVAWAVNGIPGGNSADGHICATGSDPCLPVSVSNSGSVDYIAPAGVPSPNPVSLTATSEAKSVLSATAKITILPHIVVSVQPGSATLAAAGQQRFAATVTGTDNQLVIWSIAGAACANPGVCGSIDSTGLYTAPPAAPSSGAIEIVATSLEDETQSGTASVMITSGPAIFSLAPTSAYAGSAGGFTLLVTGANFSPSDPGPGSSILITGAPRTTSCAASAQCITSLTAADLRSAANLSVQMQNPDGSLSNMLPFVVLAPGTGTGPVPLTPSAPTLAGIDIVVVELSTNGGSGAAGNVSLNIGAMGPYSVATKSCVLGGSPVIVQRPAAGTRTADLCVFSVSSLEPSFAYTVSGPPTPDITVSNREPLGLGILHLTLQVPATAAPGPRTLFVENPESDKAAGSGAIEVQ